MGMFDTVEWHDDLPLTGEMKELRISDKEWSFQTKDLDRVLEDYVVSDGYLHILRHRKEEWIPGNPGGESILDRYGYQKKEDPYLQRVDYTVSLDLLAVISDVDDRWDCTVEYNAIFVSGKLVSMKLLRFEKRDNAERKAEMAALMKSLAESAAKWYNKYLFHTRVWRQIIWRIHRVLFVIGNLFHNASRKIL